MPNIDFIRDTVLSHAKEAQKGWLEKEFYWGEYSTYPAASGIIRLEGGWYAWSNNDHSEPVFSRPIPDADIIAYLFNLRLEVEGYRMDPAKAVMYLELPKYRSLEEIRADSSGAASS